MGLLILIWINYHFVQLVLLLSSWRTISTIEIINLDYSKYEKKITEQKNKETFANLASLLKSFEIGKDTGEDLIYFVEDDYLHFEPMLEEMVASFQL